MTSLDLFHVYGCIYICLFVAQQHDIAHAERHFLEIFLKNRTWSKPFVGFFLLWNSSDLFTLVKGSQFSLIRLRKFLFFTISTFVTKEKVVLIKGMFFVNLNYELDELPLWFLLRILNPIKEFFLGTRVIKISSPVLKLEWSIRWKWQPVHDAKHGALDALEIQMNWQQISKEIHILSLCLTKEVILLH